jgi:hypothetical protein
MADGPEFSGGVVTFRPDNFLTVGLIILAAYLAAVLAVQALMRAGILASAPANPVQTLPPNTVVV